MVKRQKWDGVGWEHSSTMKRWLVCVRLRVHSPAPNEKEKKEGEERTNRRGGEKVSEVKKGRYFKLAVLDLGLSFCFDQGK